MEKKAMMIRSGASFMVNAIQKNLEEAGYDILPVDATVAAVNDNRRETDILILYLGDFVSEASELLVYLKDLCMEHEKSLILVGRKEEYEAVRNYVPEYCISAWFQRPLDMNEFLEAVRQQFDSRLLASTRKTILIVDDDVTYMQMVRDWLKDKYIVVMANSGVKALQWLATNKADLVFLDYEMPVVNGPTIFEMLKSEAETDVVPVVFLTGQMAKSSVLTAMKLRPVDYLLKSITRTELIQKLEGYFAGPKGVNSR